jgi:hypothetical protein
MYTSYMNNSSFGRFRRRLKCSIEMDLGKTEVSDMDWSQLTFHKVEQVFLVSVTQTL